MESPRKDLERTAYKKFAPISAQVRRGTIDDLALEKLMTLTAIVTLKSVLA